MAILFDKNIYPQMVLNRSWRRTLQIEPKIRKRSTKNPKLRPGLLSPSWNNSQPLATDVFEGKKLRQAKNGGGIVR
jgi:hypothetical protein